MTQTKVLQRYCEAALAVLNSQYDATKVLAHSATVGTVREQIIKDFLSAHLPELVSVVSGQIFDSQNNYSRQQDIVLVLKSMPRLPFASGNDLIYTEGVVATIEVKTELGPSTVAAVCENISSVRKLSPGAVASVQMAVTYGWPATKILTSVVTYGGSSLEAHASKLGDLPVESRPDLLLDLSKGLLVRNHGLLVPQRDSADYVLVMDAAEGFKRFLTFLTEITGTLAFRGVHWRQYW